MKPEDYLLDDTFLAWYFRSDDEEWLRWEQLRKQDPVLCDRMDEAVRMIQAITADQVPMQPGQQALVRTALMNRIQEWEGSGVGDSGQKRIGRRRLLWTGAAASVAILMTMAYWLFSEKGETVYSAEAGSTKRIELPDGSNVDLNGNSSLRTQFVKGKDREVWLEGEAYFSVSRQSGGEKFIVHTGNLDVEVLGTEFNVRGQQEKTEVVLESGKVQLSRTDVLDEVTKIVMEPGEMAEFSTSSGTITKRDVNTKVYTSWKEGKVIFENAGVSEIAGILADRYNLEVTVEDGSILGEFNGIFPSDDPDIVLLALEKTYSGKIIRRENSIVFKK